MDVEKTRHNDDDDDDDDDKDGWKILQPDVLLFETSIGSLEKPVPHPILDDPSKMMRIIANPVYDKLTIARAAGMRKLNNTQLIQQQPTKLNKRKEKPRHIRFESPVATETTIMSLPVPSKEENSKLEPHLSFIRHGIPPFRLPTPPSAKLKESEIVSTKTRSHSKATRSTTQAIQSALVDNSSNVKKPIADGTVRYVNSRHGFEVQRYASPNWLAIDVYTKDACQAHEKTFREMLDKKRQYERLSRSIYSSEYYNKRWNDLLQSYKQGHLTHAQWAEQNYQLFCLKTLYHQAIKREQSHIDSFMENERRDRAKNIFKEWKETKVDENSQHHSRLTTARSHRTTEVASFVSNNSFSSPSSKATDETNPIITTNGRNHRMSISTTTDSDLQRLSKNQSIITSKSTSNLSTSTASYVFDEQRWSLQAMLKRVVGLSEPLQQPVNGTKHRQSPITNVSNDSGIESIL